eukprot:CAMPEP_0170297314 /NCGR_PEP_ID=MMETSP0116_2-20130129/48817_1 /TAXON_ID=400756 /ORGANISM="Durinskia baltica, Strain CSIRO CS-38" /LENGTH=190 /DNA_ID=CAMNT_0010548937 /DNA_START=113 /DNA_END=682 /DNA_ORIENTATION=+
MVHDARRAEVRNMTPRYRKLNAASSAASSECCAAVCKSASPRACAQNSGHQIDGAGWPSQMHTNIDEVLETDSSDLIHVQQLEKGLRGARIEIHELQCILHVIAVELAFELLPIHLAVAVGVREDLADVVDHVHISVALRGLHRCLYKDAGHNVHDCQKDKGDVQRKDDAHCWRQARHQRHDGVVPTDAP